MSGSIPAVAPAKPRGLKATLRSVSRYWQLWLLSIPALFFVGLFAYVPMWGIQLAFRRFEPSKGITGGGGWACTTSGSSSHRPCLSTS